MFRFVVLAAALLAVTSTTARAQTALQPLLSASQWLGGKPTAAQVRGKVVVVDVFTFDCINCKHVVPKLRSLYRSTSRRDLLIVGIHSPETPYEKIRANVVSNLSLQGIVWPVAIDNSFDLWNAFGIQYWPSQLIFDRKGVLRKTIVGEGQDDEIQRTIDALIAER